MLMVINTYLPIFKLLYQEKIPKETMAKKIKKVQVA